MGFADVWNRTLVYFGIAEEDDEWDEDGYVTEEELERTYSERPNVRRLAPRGRRQEFDDWTDPDADADVARTAVVRPTRRRESSPLDDLTPREKQVLGLMAEGRSNAGIARNLWVTEGTVEKHVRSILMKLNLPETDEDHRRVRAVITFLEAR